MNNILVIKEIRTAKAKLNANLLFNSK